MVDAASPNEDDVRSVDIFLHRINGLRPIYTTSEVTAHVEFMGETLLQTDAARLDEIIELGVSFTVNFDLTDRCSYDKYISNPFIITVVETQKEIDASIVLPERPGKASWHSDDSVLDLQEALLGAQRDAEDSAKAVDSKKSKSKEGAKSKDKATKGSKTSRSSKTGRESKGKRTSFQNSANNDAAQLKPTGPQIAGIAVLDLLPIFLGKENFEETILLKEDSVKELDDRLRSVARLPTISVEVDLNTAIPKGAIYNLTIESIYNLPTLMSPEMRYQVFFKLPGGSEINFERYTYQQNTPRNEFTYKNWFETDKATLYVIKNDFLGVKNSLMSPLDKVLPTDTPRVEYNRIKRNYASVDDIDCYELQLHRYGRIGVEVYVQLQSSSDTSKSVKPKAPAKKDKKGKSETVSDAPEPDYLHLMGYVDLCRLLYPGEKTTRVLVPLRTHNYSEMEANTGLSDSKFRPKPPPPPEPEAVDESVAGDKSKKSSSKTSDKSSKSGKGGKNKSTGGNQANKLPPPPTPPEPSQLVYNEDGAQTFLVVEIEFYEPLVKARALEDLHDELETLLNNSDHIEKPRGLPVVIKSKNITEEFYKNTVKELAADIKQQYLEFVKIQQEKETTELDFLNYVQRNGIYQTYLSAIVRATTMYVNSIFDVRISHSTSEYHTFISNVYVTLVEQMNNAISEMFELGVGECKEPLNCLERLRRYAYEAMELGATGLASRYFLQRICDDESNADGWFDYAIHHMHYGQIEMATECTREALMKNQGHRNSLALYALLLARKKKISEAETCLLKATLDDPLWPEGWGMLYCLYVIKDSPEGMDVASEMGEKCLDLTPPHVPIDLSWSRALVPNTLFYRTACYLIEMRLYEEAEIMIANEVVNQEAAINEYLLAVVNYYRGDYEHAILHIDNAFNFGGCDHTKCTLRGHIFAAQNDDECALKEYKKISELYIQPEPKDLYLLFVRSGLCLSKLGNDQAARLNFLQACQVAGTAYTWLCVGVLYFHQHDFLSAEECLTLSNSLDNWMPETWAYLTLVNAKLGRAHESQLCLQQAVEHKLQSTELIVAIEEAVDEFCK